MDWRSSAQSGHALLRPSPATPRRPPEMPRATLCSPARIACWETCRRTKAASIKSQLHVAQAILAQPACDAPGTTSVTPNASVRVLTVNGEDEHLDALHQELQAQVHKPPPKSVFPGANGENPTSKTHSGRVDRHLGTNRTRLYAARHHQHHMTRSRTFVSSFGPTSLGRDHRTVHMRKHGLLAEYTPKDWVCPKRKLPPQPGVTEANSTSGR